MLFVQLQCVSLGGGKSAKCLLADFASAGPPIKLGVPWALPVNVRGGAVRVGWGGVGV
jgi:hypothetical protein